MLLTSPLKRLFWSKFGFSAVICPVLLADNAKSDNFALYPDLDMTCDPVKI